MLDNTYEPVRENENLNLPATKGDLQELRATMATKAELELFRQDMNEKLDNLPTKDDFDKLLTSVDKLVGTVNTYNDERSAETHRLKRLEDWVKEASRKVNIPFEL